MNKEREGEPQSWLIARRFPNARAALRAYEEARDLLLTEDLDASVLRFQLGGQSHLALLGELPLPVDAEQKMKAALERGSEPAALPGPVTDYLRSRRRDFKNLGFDYLERRSVDPGDQPPPAG